MNYFYRHRVLTFPGKLCIKWKQYDHHFTGRVINQQVYWEINLQYCIKLYRSNFCKNTKIFKLNLNCDKVGLLWDVSRSC